MERNTDYTATRTWRRFEPPSRTASFLIDFAFLRPATRDDRSSSSQNPVDKEVSFSLVWFRALGFAGGGKKCIMRGVARGGERSCEDAKMYGTTVAGARSIIWTNGSENHDSPQLVAHRNLSLVTCILFFFSILHSPSLSFLSSPVASSASIMERAANDLFGENNNTAWTSAIPCISSSFVGGMYYSIIIFGPADPATRLLLTPTVMDTTLLTITSMIRITRSEYGL